MSEPGLDRLTTLEAGALLAWHLAHGEVLTVNQAAEVTRRSRSNTWRMLCSISRVIPIVDIEGEWHVVSTDVPPEYTKAPASVPGALWCG